MPTHGSEVAKSTGVWINDVLDVDESGCLELGLPLPDSSAAWVWQSRSTLKIVPSQLWDWESGGASLVFCAGCLHPKAPDCLPGGDE